MVLSREPRSDAHIRCRCLAVTSQSLTASTASKSGIPVCLTCLGGLPPCNVQPESQACFRCRTADVTAASRLNGASGSSTGNLRVTRPCRLLTATVSFDSFCDTPCAYVVFLFRLSATFPHLLHLLHLRFSRVLAMSQHDLFSRFLPAHAKPS